MREAEHLHSSWPPGGARSSAGVEEQVRVLWGAGCRPTSSASLGRQSTLGCRRLVARERPVSALVWTPGNLHHAHRSVASAHQTGAYLEGLSSPIRPRKPASGKHGRFAISRLVSVGGWDCPAFCVRDSTNWMLASGLRRAKWQGCGGASLRQPPSGMTSGLLPQRVRRSARRLSPCRTRG